MRAFAFVVVAAWLTACAGAQHPAAPVFAPADDAAIRGVLDRQIAAWNRGDLTSFMDGYAHTPALVFTSGGHIRRGWQAAFDAYHKRYATDPTAMGQLGFTLETIDGVGGDAAIVVGHFNLTGTEHAGHGVFSLVFERRPEGWRIVHDHTSADSP